MVHEARRRRCIFFVEMPLEEFLKLDDVEELEDDDMFTWDERIDSLDELIEAVEY